MKRILTLVAVFALLLSSGSQASLVDRGGGMIYDTSQNITWLQNANYALTSQNLPSDYKMTWYAAMGWAEQLTYAGYDDWRLPTSIDLNNVAPCNGQCPNTEFGHLYYEIGYTGNPQTGPFSNLYQGLYWTSTQSWGSENRDYALLFIFAFPTPPGGVAGDRFKGSELGHAWAVRNGDVTPVPLPSAALLFGSGLAMVWGRIAWGRRRRINRNF
jgi:hypothetical protein